MFTLIAHVKSFIAYSYWDIISYLGEFLLLVVSYNENYSFIIEHIYSKLTITEQTLKIPKERWQGIKLTYFYISS